MAVKDRTAALAPYVQQLLYNSDVQASARQAGQAIRAAYRRARGKHAEEIIQDKKLRRQVNKAASAISGLWKDVEESRPKQKSRWRWPAIALGLAAGGALLVTIGNGRARLSELLGGTNKPDSDNAPADPATLSTDAGTAS
jgi:hypothetical protein